MNYKKLSKEQLIISFDRLTRFKHTKQKYLRVFYDIILSNLIEPKFKRNELDNLDAKTIRDYATIIINNSLLDNTSSRSINKKIKEYENSVCYNDNDTQILLDNDIDYEGAFSLLKDASAVNLKWLLSLLDSTDLIKNRKYNSLKFPVEKILLVEGLTEEILLPAFAKVLGYDFDKEGIHIIPAGGKNQVVKMYYQLIEEIKIPIFLLLDKDAEENIKQIKPKLRNTDKIHLISCGEFEDILPKSLIVKTINKELTNFASITEKDLDDGLPEAKSLENIFKKVGLHEFKKADFSKLVKENITNANDASDEIKNILNELINN